MSITTAYKAWCADRSTNLLAHPSLTKEELAIASRVEALVGASDVLSAEIGIAQEKIRAHQQTLTRLISARATIDGEVAILVTTNVDTP